MTGKRKATGDASPASTKRARFDATPIPAGPGGPMEIVFSFDTTGSMSSCLVEVRKNLTDMINRLQKDIPGLRMAVFAHGDYCDAESYYVTKYVDFTNDVTKLVDFVNNVSGTGGGDSDECYELVLYEVRTKLSWSPGTQKSLVMIGDADPHEPDYPQNTLKLDWREEIDKLSKDQVHIYGVNCGRGSSEKFYKTLASKTDGKYVQLSQWNNIFDMMMAICYREHGAEFFKAYEHEVRSRGPAVTHEMDAMLKTLRHSDDEGYDTESVDPDSAGSAASSSTSMFGRAPTKFMPPKMKKPRATKAKVTGTAKKTAKKPKKTVIKRELRESLGKHPFTTLNWSHWHRLMTKTKPTNRTSKHWIPRKSGTVGFRRIGLFKGDIRGVHKPAFYEVGVKLPGSQKVNAVYFRMTNGFRRQCHIDNYILRHAHLFPQIDDVLKSGCDVCVRMAELPKKINIDGTKVSDTDKLTDYVRKNYDYAWCKRVYGRRRHRVVVKRGIKISDDKY